MLFALWIPVGIILLILWLWDRRKNLPPGPWGLPIFGYLLFLNSGAPHATLAKLSKKYGPIYGLSLGSVYTVVLSDPKLIRTVLSDAKTAGRAPLFLTHGIMKGYGLICAEGELWKDQRRFVFSCFKKFGGTRLNCKAMRMENLIMPEVSDLINYIKNYPEDDDGNIILNPSDPLKHNVGSVINKIVFGRTYSRDDEVWRWLVELQDEGTKFIGVAGPLNFLPFLRHIPYFENMINFILDGKADTHSHYLEVINEEAENLKTLREHDPNYEPRSILHAFLLEKEKKMGSTSETFYSNEQFLHLLADLFGAGLDTSSATLKWFLLYIAYHPGVQTRIQRQIDFVTGGNMPSYVDVNDMHYLAAAFAETQRMRPVVPTGIPHGALADIEVDGYRVPKGTMIVPLQWAVHMNEDTWQDPENFNPDRFINQEGKFIKHDSLIPFQSGKRVCIGSEIAKMVLFLFGASILQEFSIFPPDGVPLDDEGVGGITFNPKDYKLVFRSRR